MLVVAWMTGRQLSVPVEIEAHLFQLGLGIPDVLIGPCLRTDIPLNSSVLSRQPETIPAHRIDDMFASLLIVASEHITDSVDAQMTHMNLTGWIWELT